MSTPQDSFVRVGFDDINDRPVHQAVGSNDLFSKKIILPAAKIGYRSACLPDNEAARGNIPWRQSLFPECIIASGGSIREVQRRGTKPAQRLCFLHDTDKIVNS